MNIMLVSVTERIKEIGIRKAIGATKRYFNSVSHGSSFPKRVWWYSRDYIRRGRRKCCCNTIEYTAVIPLDWAFIGLLVCSVIGIGFGIYPAWRAAQLDPIESLRFE